jgi:hypothetical protein
MRSPSRSPVFLTSVHLAHDVTPRERTDGEIAWSVEEGALAKFDTAHALAIACKKFREGRWSTPFRMPVDWTWKRALPELCSGAGGN